MNRESINIRDIAHQIYEIFIFLLWQLFWLRDFESILAKHCDRPMQVSAIMTGFRFDHVRYKWSLWRSIQVPSNEQANKLIHPRDDLLVRIRHVFVTYFGRISFSSRWISKIFWYWLPTADPICLSARSNQREYPRRYP